MLKSETKDCECIGLKKKKKKKDCECIKLNNIILINWRRMKQVKFWYIWILERGKPKIV